MNIYIYNFKINSMKEIFLFVLSLLFIYINIYKYYVYKLYRLYINMMEYQAFHQRGMTYFFEAP